MCLWKLTALLERLATSHAPQSNASGTCQCDRSNVAPGGKYSSNWPPSGPSQKRSSPPNTFMCDSLEEARILSPRAAAHNDRVASFLLRGVPSDAICAFAHCEPAIDTMKL